MSSPSGPSPAGESLPGSAEQHAPATSGPDDRTGAVPPGTAPAGSAPAKGRRPWGWIVVCVLLLLVAGGFAVWALGLQSDLDDQKTQTAQAQQEAEQANEAVSALSAPRSTTSLRRSATPATSSRRAATTHRGTSSWRCSPASVDTG